MTVSLAQVVAVVASFPDGTHRLGSGYLVGNHRVLTAAHCLAGRARQTAIPRVTIHAAVGGSRASASLLATASAPDLAVLELNETCPWANVDAPSFGAVNRTESGILTDCVAIGFPAYERSSDTGEFGTAELHGDIYQTDGAESGRLLLREWRLTTVQAPRAGDSPWGGLSGALVVHAGLALGVVIKHHPQQGSAALQLSAFDSLLELSKTDPSAEHVALAIGLRSGGRLANATASPFQPLSTLVEALDPTSRNFPVVKESDPYTLGTTPSDYGDRDTYGRGDEYVARTAYNVDERLRGALQPGQVVVLTGPSKVGKTRTAFEAIKVAWPEARVVVPISDSLAELSRHPRVRLTSDPLIIWLDDLNRFLASAAPLTVALCKQFSDRGGPVVVVATLRADARDRLRRDGELDRETGAVLNLAKTIQLQSTLADPAEQAAAERLYLGGPLAGIGLGEMLGYAPQLLQVYQDSTFSDPAARSVVQAAVDWARVGLDRPIQEFELVSLARGALWLDRPDWEVSDTDLMNAIRATRTPILGSRSAAQLRTVAVATGVRAYRAFDYLVAADDGQGGRPRAIPTFIWDEALKLAAPGEYLAVAESAHTRGKMDVAAAAARRGALHGDSLAMYNLGLLLSIDTDPPDLVEARRWYKESAKSGNVSAAHNLAVLLATRTEPPDWVGARHWWELAARRGHQGSMMNLARHLASTGEARNRHQARALYAQVVELGDRSTLGDHAAAFNLGVLAASEGKVQDAIRWYEVAATGGNTMAAFNLGTLLASPGQHQDLDSARTWLVVASRAGSAEAMSNLSYLLTHLLDPPDVVSARYWSTKAQATRGATSTANFLN